MWKSAGRGSPKKVMSGFMTPAVGEGESESEEVSEYEEAWFFLEDFFFWEVNEGSQRFRFLVVVVVVMAE